MHCTNCGKELAGEVKLCDGCGTPVVSEQNNNQAQAQPAQSAPVNQEAQENKVIFILSYILFFLPLVSCPGSKIGRFHANQGLVLLITSVAGQIAVTILSSILLSISRGQTGGYNIGIDTFDNLNYLCHNDKSFESCCILGT